MKEEKELVVYNTIGNEEYIKHIKYVLNHVPKDVGRKICEECCIVLFPQLSAGTYYTKINRYLLTIDPWLIKIRKISTKGIRYILAHEFAHHILGHDQSGMTESEVEKINNVLDKKADALAENWGFPKTEELK